MKISNLIGKPLISNTGEQFGYVKSAYVTKKLNSLSALICVDHEEEEFYLPARAIMSVGDAVIAGSARLKEPSGQPSPIGKTVYTEKGEWLGIVSDLTAEDKGRLTVRKDGTDADYSASRAIIGDVIILKNERPPRTAAKQPAEKQTEPAPAAQKSEPASKTPQRETIREHKEYAGNLLGRRVKENIVYKNMVFIPAGTVITPAVIRTAAAHNLLLALQRNSAIVF